MPTTRSEYEVAEGLKATLEEGLGEEVEVVIDYPDSDNMKKKSMVFLNLDYGELEEENTVSDIVNMKIEMYLLCKGDRNANLNKKVWTIYKQLYDTIRDNPTLGGVADFAIITNWDFYPEVEGSVGTVAIRADIRIQWQR